MVLLLLLVHAVSVRFALSSPLTSPTSPSPTRSTIPDLILASASAAATCTDIAICRTRYTIVWSSLVTILACVWTAVHRNVPAPEEPGESRIWRFVGQVLEAGKIVVVTVLVPEWVLAWAVRQCLNARQVRKELEWARGGTEQEIPDWIKYSLRDRLEAARRLAATPLSSKENGIQEGAPRHAATGHLKEKSTEAQLAIDTVNINNQNGRLSGEWTTRHGFAVIMGGFHFYKNGMPQYPLSRYDVIVLVYSGQLVPPTDEEIRNWSQSDGLSKTLAVVQTLWFVVQAIARRVEGLPITQLEIMTLAYTSITVAMYVTWWDKPKNVSGPFRIAVKELPELVSVDEWTWYRHIFYLIAGWHDRSITLRKERRVPTFYGGGILGGDANTFGADVIALIAAMVFGAVHCAAWHYVFPSYAEKIIWRVSSLAIVALPAAMLIPILLMLVESLPDWDVLDQVLPFMFALFAPVYVAARLLLLALSFTTLRSLPSEAYSALQWTLLVPHFT